MYATPQAHAHTGRAPHAQLQRGQAGPSNERGDTLNWQGGRRGWNARVENEARGSGGAVRMRIGTGVDMDWRRAMHGLVRSDYSLRTQRVYVRERPASTRSTRCAGRRLGMARIRDLLYRHPF